MIMPRADPETALTEAAPWKAMGLPVGVGGLLAPVEATVGLATPDGLELGQTVTVTVLKFLVSKGGLDS